MNSFVDELRRTERVLVGRGQCVEQFGGGEPYLPFFDALHGLSRGADGEAVRKVLRTHAPASLLQKPGLVDDDDVEALRRRVADAPPDRIKRELAEALEAISTVAPEVLACEDLHAADRWSIELLSYLARRPHRARLLVIGTYRPAEAAVRSHPVRSLAADLRLRQRCCYLDLELLSPRAVGTYLARRLAPAEPAASLAHEVYQHTDGNALFMTVLVEHLLGGGGRERGPMPARTAASTRSSSIGSSRTAR